MGSMNNWLGFSLAPHMTVDMNQTAGVGTSMSMIMSNFSESNVGYGGTDGFELPSNSSASLAMADMSSLRSGDGSLCLFEAMNRTHNAGGGGGEWQKCLSSQSEAVKTENNSNEQKRPKLEDLLGGAFVGGVQFSDDASTDINTSELDRIYGKAPVFDRDSDQNPSLKTAMVGDHMHMKGVASDVTVTDSSKGQTDHPALRSGPMHDLYNQNNDHDTSNEDAYNMFSDCSLQLSQSSMNNNNNNNMYGLSDFKTWLRSQSSDEQSKVIHDNCLPNSGATTEPTTNKESFALAIPASASIQAKSPAATNSNNEDTSSSESKKRSLEQAITPVNTTAKKSLDTFGQRTSIYRGVTRHRWTGRYEAHLWDNSCRRDGQTRKGRQVYLGGYDKEEKAARAYDLAALKYWGPSTTTNFPIANYEKELEEMKHMTRQEYVASLRRKSSGFSRGASIYRGVTRHHQHGRWQARIGRVAGNKDLYLGTFSTQEEAAEAYDIAAIKFRGLNAVTNFDMSRYDVKSIMNSALPIGGLAKRIKEAESAQLERTVDGSRLLHDEDSTLSSHTDNASYGTAASSKDWPLLAFQQQANPSLQTAYQQRGLWWKQISDQQATHQDFQLQLHPYAYHQKYLQPPNGTVLHNLMGLESAAINDVNNSTATGLYTDISNTLAANSLVMPNSSIPSANSSVASATDNSRAAHFSDNSEGSVASKTSTYENLYYLTQQQQQQQQSSGLGRVTYETSACNNWVAPSLQSLGSRPNLAVCHAPVFTVWSDT